MSSRSLPLLLLLVGCEGNTIKFPTDTGGTDDTGGGDTDTDTDTGGDTADTTDTEDPFTGFTPLVDADIVLEAESRGDGTGYPGSLSAVPDVTGDGVGDLLVGARSATSGANYAGAAYLVSDPPPGTSNLADAYTRFTSDVMSGQFGTAVSDAGDVNGDGYQDIAIGAPYLDGGSVFVYHGPFSAGVKTTEDAATMLVAEAEYSYLGMAIRAGGDLDGDGQDDLVLGSSYDSEGCAGCGSVYVNLAADTEGTVLVSDDAVRIFGDRTRGQIGSAVSNGTDLDGDGALDLVVGAPYSADGGVAVLYGPFRSGSFELGDADAWFAGESTGSYTGSSITGADVDGDGYEDLIVGAPYTRVGGNAAPNGTAYVEFGGATRWDGEATIGSGASYTGTAGDYAGTSVTNAGDVDGDGTIDLLVGAPYSSAGEAYGGAAYLAYGPLVPGDFDLGDTEAIFAGTQQYGYGGYSVAGAGDLDADSDAEIAIGAQIGLEAGRGAIFVFLGD